MVRRIEQLPKRDLNKNPLTKDELIGISAYPGSIYEFNHIELAEYIMNKNDILNLSNENYIILPIKK